MPKPQPRTKIIVATTNPGKLTEIKKILAGLPYRLLSPADLSNLPQHLSNIEETGTTFLENAILKAKALGNYTQIPAIAEDSGLIVDSLSGRPGIYSHRFGPTDGERNLKVITELQGVPDQLRTARFICSAVLYFPLSGKIFTADGIVEGRIVASPLGSYGFGYDPIFYAFELKKTFAQASLTEKSQVSHRGRAFNQIKQFLLKNPL